MYFGNYKPSSFGWSAPSSGDIVPFSYDGVSFPAGVHRLAVPVFKAALDRIVPHLAGGLKAGSCWGYDSRPVRGGTLPSFHSYGLAIDINASDNPSIPDGKEWEHTMPNTTASLIKPLGMEWGGAWDSPKDYMHIEIHLSPQELRDMASSLPTEEDDMTEEQVKQAVKDVFRERWLPTSVSKYTPVELLGMVDDLNANLAAANRKLDEVLAKLSA